MIFKKHFVSFCILFSAVAAIFLIAANWRPDQVIKNHAKPIIFFEEKFEDTNFVSRGWYDNTTLYLSTTEHNPGSTKSAEYHWQTGDTKPVSGGGMRKKFAESGEVYVSFWVKYSSNYTGSNKPYHPHEFHIMTNKNGDYSGLSFTHLTAYIEQNEGNPLLALQDAQNIDQAKIGQDLQKITENRGVQGCNGLYPDGYTGVDCYDAGGGQHCNGKHWIVKGTSISNTVWHHVEAYFKLNNIQKGKGVGDGILRYWLDNQLLINNTNLLMRTGQYPDMKFNQFIIAPWIGDGSPVDQTFWIDDLIVGNVRPE
jgi:hypothetical protein